MPTPFETIRNYEMSKFGLDPTKPEDLNLWDATAPQNPDAPVVDYSQDAFAFGGLPAELPAQPTTLDIDR